MASANATLPLPKAPETGLFTSFLLGSNESIPPPGPLFSTNNYRYVLAKVIAVAKVIADSNTFIDDEESRGKRNVEPKTQCKKQKEKEGRNKRRKRKRRNGRTNQT